MTRASLVLFALFPLACSKAESMSENRTVAEPSAEPSDPHAALDEVSIEKVSELLAAKQAVAVDANDGETRAKFGTVPGAILLSWYGTYALSELPADKSTQLVFYCGSKGCNSAPYAAERAKKGGYTSVSVMRAGIKGWVAAGKPVSES